MTKRRCRSGKVRHNDRQQAIAAMHLLQSKSTHVVKPRRVYHCQTCNGWHLTSEENIGSHDDFERQAGVVPNYKRCRTRRRILNLRAVDDEST